AVGALARAVPPPGPGHPAFRRALAGGSLLGLAFLAGEPVTAALGALSWAVVALWTWRPRPLPAVAVAAAAAALLAAPVLVPLLAVYPDTVRGGLAAARGALGADALAPRRFLELVFPNLLGSPLGDGTSGFWARPSFPWQRYYPVIFVGALPILCLPAAWRRRRDLAPWWVLAAAGTAGALVLAPHGIAVAAQDLPVLGSVRYAIKFLVLPVLALTPLVAEGWAALVGSWRSGARRYVRAVALATVVLAAMVLFPSALLRPALAALYPASRPGLAAVTNARLASDAACDCLALALPAAAAAVLGPSSVGVTAVALAANLAGGSGVLLFDRSARWAAPPQVRNVLPAAPVIAVLEAPEPHGFLASPLDRFWIKHEALVPESGTRWGVRYVLARGPDGLEPLRQELLAAATAQMTVAERGRVARALGANAVIALDPIAGWRGARVGALWVGALDAPSPHAYLARRLLPAEGMLAAATTMASDGFRPGEDVVVLGRGGARPSGQGSVATSQGPPHRQLFDVTADAPAVLVVQQSFMTCWRATVDGRPTPTEPVNGAATGVRVPAGTHRVDLFIDPWPYRAGAVGPLVLGLVAALTRRRGSSRGPAGASSAGGHNTPATAPAP
ncbi:MAG TPA: hypothetical protein VMT19_12320, partial [Thermoanaerobaculaceae bacterium]|nr:hypothetical protein [Thermoanaerobaculaceae bacterium]